MNNKSVLTLAVIAAALACSDGMTPLTRVPTGAWHGDNARLVATDTGATMAIGCEADTIRQQLVLGASGEFDWQGVAGMDGNVVNPTSHPARFTGQATATRLAITRTVTDGSGIEAQSHVLTPGVGVVPPCAADRRP